jgi:hypothetical protein
MTLLIFVIYIIAAGYELDGRGSIPGKGKIFLFTASRPALGPARLLSNGYR